jgi:hypothetical protein
MQRHSRLLIEHLAKDSNIDLVVVHPHPNKIFSDKPIKEELISPINKNKNYLSECYKYSKRVYEVILKHPDTIIFSRAVCLV